MTAEQPAAPRAFAAHRLIFCVRCLVVAGGFFLLPMFLIILKSFVAYHSETNDVTNMLYYDMLFMFVVVPCAMVVSLLPLPIFKSNFISRLLCLVTVLLAIFMSGPFAGDLVRIGDKIFFRLHKGAFEELVAQAGPGSPSVIVFKMREASLVRWFVFFNEFKVPEGFLPKDIATKINRTNDGFDEGSCLYYASHLEGKFYVISGGGC